MLLICGLLAVVAGWCGEPAAFERDAYPAMMKLGELTNEWAVISIAPAVGGPSLPYGGMMSLALLSQMPAVCYSKGQTVNLGGRSYLVIYRAEITQPRNEDDFEFIGLLTADTPVLPALAPVEAIEDMVFLGRFDLKAEIERSEKQRMRPFEQDMQVDHEPQDDAGWARKHLQDMRVAIARFKEDTGAWPAALADLVKPAENAPASGIDNDGKPVEIAPATYAGPYLKSHGGSIKEAPGIPRNPYIDMEMKEPDPGLVATHWHYHKGAVSVPEYMFGIRTTDGVMLGEL